jgi:AraC-like DNA-binding protein
MPHSISHFPVADVAEHATTDRDGADAAFLGGSIITGVALVDRITRTEQGPYQSVSLPGHLLQVVVQGRVEQQAAGIHEEVKAGDAVWYFENEEIRGRIIEVPWTFYTIAFFAPTLSPPPFGSRVRPIGPQTIERAASLLAHWRNTAAPPALRHIRIHALLLELLLELLADTNAAFRTDVATQLWWELEAKLRSDLSAPITMRYLALLCQRSPQTIARACFHAVGMSPLKRVKELRLSYAQGLVQLSQQTMTEIAMKTGYQRIQEFSRDYRKHFGTTPTADRQRGSKYRNIERPAGP